MHKLRSQNISFASSVYFQLFRKRFLIGFTDNSVIMKQRFGWIRATTFAVCRRCTQELAGGGNKKIEQNKPNRNLREN